MPNIQIAYHASTWGSDGLLKCLEDLHDLSFRYVEIPGEVARHYYDKLYAFRNLLAMHGLELVAMRVRGRLANSEKRDQEIAYNKMVCEFLKGNHGKVFVISGGKRPPDGPSDDDLRRLADFCHEIGAFCKHLGIKACIYTALDSLVQTRDDIDRIMEITEPELLHLCPDTGHLTKAGADPLHIINAHIGRIAHIYFKDVDMQGITDPKDRNTEFSFAELGRGPVDFPAIMETLRGANYGGTITIELEKTRRTPRESVEISKQYVEGVLGIAVHPHPVPVISEAAPPPQNDKTLEIDGSGGAK